jgi:hypothetical protein
MANEFTVQFNLVLANGNYGDRISLGQLNFDQAAIGRGGHVQSVGTTEETLDFGDVSTEGLFYVRNLDGTNFVEIGPQVGTGNGQLDIKLEAGDFFFGRIKAASAWRAKADTAACLLDVRCYED